MARGTDFERTRVLDKALDLFWTRGYAATSMQDLVDHLGLNRSSIYNTFGDKRSLFIECLERYRTKQVPATLALVEQCDDPIDAVRRIFAMVLENDITARIPRGCFIVNSAVELGPHDAKIAAIIQAHDETVHNVLMLALKKGQAHGRISRKHDPDVLARFIHNNISGIRIAMKGRRSAEAVTAITNVIVSVLECDS